MRNPLSLPAFLAWVEKQPADKTYLWVDHETCACAQYSAFIGAPEQFTENPRPSFWDEADMAAFDAPHTFGALASRLRERVS